MGKESSFRLRATEVDWPDLGEVKSLKMMNLSISNVFL